MRAQIPKNRMSDPGQPAEKNGASNLGQSSDSAHLGGQRTIPCRHAAVSRRWGCCWVFLMLLWGDFTLTLMEAVAPSIVPLRLKDLGTSDFFLMIITQTIPLIIGTFTNPIISTASDRHRGPMGRRIPFMLFSTPFICGSLVLMAYSTEFGMWLHTHIGAHQGWSQNAMLILGMAILWVLFQILNMFAGTVYFYTFNDVVPPLFLSRFFALFRLVGFLGDYNLELVHLRAGAPAHEAGLPVRGGGLLRRFHDHEPRDQGGKVPARRADGARDDRENTDLR